MRKMRDTGVEWIGEVPEGWEIGRIRSLFREVSERYDAQSNNQLPLLSVSEYYGVAKREDKIKTGEVLVRAESLDGYKVCRAGDIVSNIMLAWKGALGFSPLSGIVSPAYSVYRPLKDVCSKYFHYLFRTDRYTDVFNKYSTGIIASRLRLYSPEFYAIPAIIPPLPEQRRIADYLDEKCAAIDGAVDELKRGIEDCKAWKKAIIFEAVTGKANVLAASACAKATADKKSAKVAKRQMRDSGIPWIGEIPEGWEVRRLKGVLARPLQYGASESGIGYNEALPRYIRITDITLDGKLKGEGALSLTEEAASDYILRDQDILLARSGATVGKAFLYEKQMGRAAFAGYLIRATVDVAKALPRFVYYTTLGCGYDDWRSSIAVSATIQNIGADKYNNYSLPIPPMKEQQAIADYLDEKCAAIDALVAEKEKLIADLEAYKKSLIFELVTGKREVA